MLKYIIRHNWINYAHIKHTGYPFNETTIVKDGRGQITGTLGEMAFGRWLTDLDIDFEYCADDSMNFDFKVGEYRIDVKTKKTHGVPRPDYMVRIPKSQERQQCVMYVFAYATDHEIYLLGFASKSEFWSSLGHSVKAGDKTESHTEKVDAQFAYIRDLTDMQRLDLMLSDF